MSTKKRLGKGLEDISHLFLSKPSPDRTPEREPSPIRVRGDGLMPDARVWMALSLVPQLPSAFFAANLSIELARAGKRVLAVETSSGSSLDELLGTAPIHPTINDLLEQPEKRIAVEGPCGVKLLSFQLGLESLHGFAPEEKEILSQVLRREEEEAELLLLHAVYDENPVFGQWTGMVQGVVLTVGSDPETLLETYQVCKYLFQLQPDLRIRLNRFESGEKETSAEGLKRLGDAVGHFLGKSIEWYGVIPNDPLIERSITAKVPLSILAPASITASGFSTAAKRLISEIEGASNNPGPVDSFFGRLSFSADPVEK